MVYMCSWCGGIIKMTTAEPLQAESNGICTGCLTTHFPKESQKINENGRHNDPRREAA